MKDKTNIGIGLISHTNIGKTTLARTLLRRDVGEIRDEAHVTLESTGYRLMETDKGKVTLWDTPGFGGAFPARLIKRLQNQGSALNWLQRQVIDKFTDKPLFSSVEAARTLASRCDAALYLVNAMDAPADAAYIPGELDLIHLLGIPVVLTINQVSPSLQTRRQHLEETWRDHFGSHPAVHDVVVFDAFSRHWFEEIHALRAVSNLLAEQKQQLFISMLQTYFDKHLLLEERAAGRIAEILQFAASQRLEKAKQPKGKKALAKMLSQLQPRITTFVEQITDDYNLNADNSPSLQADIDALEGLTKNLLPEMRTGLLAGAVSGASYGLAADMVAGGLSFGGGAMVGFLLGGVGGLFAAKGINAVLAGGDHYRWKTEFLKHLLQQLLLIYLLIAHHGRGRGEIDFDTASPHWLEIISKAIAANEREIDSLFSSKHGETSQYTSTVHTLLRNVFGGLFPDYEEKS